jgi:hypothetical protein
MNPMPDPARSHPGDVDGGEPAVGGTPSTGLDAAVTAMVTHLGAVHDEPITRIVIEPLDCGRGDDPRPAEVAVHAYNADGLRVDARYIEASP